jgi:hypothetical protein
MIQEYKFRVEREAEESKRKQIEADGIAAFQKTVSQGISESYLRWRGIEATLLLAQSPNSKVVIIGSGKDGLPIILGNVDTPAPGATPPAGASPPSGTTPPPPGTLPPGMSAPGGGSGKPPAGTSGQATPSNPDDTAAAAGPAGNEAQAASSSPITLPSVQSILSRITGTLLPPGVDTSSNAPAKPQPSQP